MKPYLVAAALLVALSGCGKKEEAKPALPPEVVKQVIEAQGKAELADKQRQNEERLRLEAEKGKKTAEEEKTKSQYIIIGLLALTIIALLIGVAIGSSSRKDAARRKNAIDE